MSEADFRVLLIAASFLTARFGQEFVVQTLPFEFRYHVDLNESFDTETDDDYLRPDDLGRTVAMATEDDVVSLLYRDGRCPDWIDVLVLRVGDEFTELHLICSGRFTDDREKMCYNNRGLGPFGIKSPVLPPGFVEGTKFSIPPSKP